MEVDGGAVLELARQHFQDVPVGDWVTGAGHDPNSIYVSPLAIHYQYACKFSHTHTHTQAHTRSLTSAEASDVTSIKFSARKANTAAARTGTQSSRSLTNDRHSNTDGVGFRQACFQDAIRRYPSFGVLKTTHRQIGGLARLKEKSGVK